MRLLGLRDRVIMGWFYWKGAAGDWDFPWMWGRGFANSRNYGFGVYVNNYT